MPKRIVSPYLPKSPLYQEVGGSVNTKELFQQFFPKAWNGMGRFKPGRFFSFMSDCNKWRIENRPYGAREYRGANISKGFPGVDGFTGDFFSEDVCHEILDVTAYYTRERDAFVVQARIKVPSSESRGVNPQTDPWKAGYGWAYVCTINRFRDLDEWRSNENLKRMLVQITSIISIEKGVQKSWDETPKKSLVNPAELQRILDFNYDADRTQLSASLPLGGVADGDGFPIMRFHKVANFPINRYFVNIPLKYTIGNDPNKFSVKHDNAISWAVN